MEFLVRLRRYLTLASIFAGFWLFVPTSAVASDVFKPVLQEELKMTSEPLAPGAPAIILYRQVDRDDSGENGREVNYVRIKILTEEGRKYADVEIPFLKGNGTNITGVKARTIRPDGSIVNFEGKPFEKSIVKAKGVRYMAKTFTMPDVQVGGIIEYTYTEELPSFLVFDSHWILNDELFTKNASFSLKPSSSLGCRWSWHLLPEGSEKPKQGSDHVVHLQVKNVPAFRTEDYMPPVNELKSRVDFTYSYENPSADPQKFWVETGKKLNSSLDDFVGKRKAMEQAVEQIVSPSDTPEQKLEKIYARVQQIRNTSFEVEKSEQEAKRNKQKELRNVEEVWKQGYGTGVQLTWLFLGLARAAGLDASGVWVSDRRSYFFNSQYMDDGKLTTNVVLVKVNGKEIYFDPGSAFTPYGMLPWSETGVQGLRVDKNGGTWVTTWLPHSDVSRIERKADLRLAATGELEGTVKFTFTGLEAVRLRLEQRHSDAAERKKYLESLVDEEIPVAAEVELTSQPDWTSSSATFVAEYKVKVPGWMSGAGRRALFPVGLFAAPERHVFDHSERIHPIYFEYPFEKQDDVTITLPVGWEIGSVPAPQAQGSSTSPLAYAFKADKDNGTLHLNRKLMVDVLLLEPKYYSALRTFFQSVRTGDEEQVVLQPIGARVSKQ
jgi:Domain of Unknown Function with PDB structure (DUF3857)